MAEGRPAPGSGSAEGAPTSGFRTAAPRPLPRLGGLRAAAGPRPTVGLSLIARDEERTLPRLLASCSGAFDQVVLADTGSSDGTVAAFRAWAATQADTDCQVVHVAWTDDFAVARQASLDRVSTDWVCWADCDDTIVGAGELRDVVRATPAEVGGFDVTYDYSYGVRGPGVFLLDRRRLVRTASARWTGRIHEDLSSAGGVGTIPPERVRWLHHHDGGSETRVGPRARHERDLRILREEIAADPADARSHFYLAQTLRDLGRPLEAAQSYGARADLGGWEQEAAYARFQQGSLLAAAGDWPGGFAALVTAWEMRPQRLEPLHEIVRLLRARGEHHAAVAFVLRGLDRPRPDDRLFVHDWIYAWGLRYEHSIVGYWGGDVAGALRSCELLLERDDLPAERREETVLNLEHCRRRLAEEGG